MTSEASTAGSRAQIVVLHSVPAPRGQTRFIVQLEQGAPPELSLRYFTWRAALFDSYDVFHLHWPEFLLRAGSRRSRFMKAVLLLVLLQRLRLRGTPIVRTLHNLVPHEPGSTMEQWLLGRVERRTALFIKLNPTTPDVGSRSITILHGHYRDRFAPFEGDPSRAGRILNFGLIRRYKGIERLLTVFNELSDPSLSLRIVGKPVDVGLARSIEAAADRDARVTHDLRFVADDELVREVCAAEVVILPYEEMHNSGTLLVALSMSRPVIVPRSPSNQAISDEVGPGWVFQYDGPLEADVIRDAMQKIAGREAGGRRLTSPDLTGRDWSRIGETHYNAYRSLLEL